MKTRLGLIMLTALIIAFALYLVFGAVAYFEADKLIFQPQPIDFKDKSFILKLVTPNGEKIAAKFFKNDTAEYTILYSHGNAEDIHGLSPFFEELSRAGFNVLAYDYRGYGISEGRPSEQNSYQDIETAYNYLVDEQKIAPEKIIIHGRSLGGAVSVDLASRKKCGGLIVESSFTSAFRFLTRYRFYPFDRFDSLDKISRVKCPILFIHGTDDTLVPFWHTQRLFEKANEPKTLFAVEKAEHNDVFVVARQTYLEKIIQFANGLKSSS